MRPQLGARSACQVPGGPSDDVHRPSVMCERSGDIEEICRVHHIAARLLSSESDPFCLVVRSRERFVRASGPSRFDANVPE